jgi:GNAT superfamily N-acetyltransferase
LVKKFLDEGIGEYGWGVDEEDLHKTFHAWDPRFGWALVDKGKMVGCLAGIVVTHFFNRRNTIFQEFMWYVLPEYRRTGGGIMLYRACERDCRALGITRLAFAHTKYMSEQFEKLYKGLGFTYLETQYEKVL